MCFVDHSDPDNFPQPVDFWLMELDFLDHKAEREDHCGSRAHVPVNEVGG